MYTSLGAEIGKVAADDTLSLNAGTAQIASRGHTGIMRVASTGHW
jgi:hypothetical protein